MYQFTHYIYVLIPFLNGYFFTENLLHGPYHPQPIYEICQRYARKYVYYYLRKYHFTRTFLKEKQECLFLIFSLLIIK